MSNPAAAMPSVAVVLFRRDLRIADHPALFQAVRSGIPVAGLFIYAPEDYGEAQRWWLHHSLTQLKKSLAKHEIPLVVSGESEQQVIERIKEQSGADQVQVYWNKRWLPLYAAHDLKLAAYLDKSPYATVHMNPSDLLCDPVDLRTKEGKPFRVFTPFARAGRALCVQHPQSVLPIDPPPFSKLPKDAQSWLMSTLGADENLNKLQLLPRDPDWSGGFAIRTPGHEAGLRRLQDFLQTRLSGYAGLRDRCDANGTSGLSPHLALGEISPRMVWSTIADARGGAENLTKFQTELLWREFHHHTLVHFPHATSEPLQDKFRNFPWRADPAALEAWKKGKTGYPLVDAGMRELWQTGVMHNRVRMVVASFLTKHLMLPWQVGERWFWDTLLDADIACNALNWQWVAGSGFDAAPYFRIFNPYSQQERFDPERIYVRRWVPEVDRADYPLPIVDHSFARQRALSAWSDIK